MFNFKFPVFLDFNPFYIKKVYSILKKHYIDLIIVDFPYGINSLRLITKIPISYNAHNVEVLYFYEIGRHFPKIPKILRGFFQWYIFILEKYAIKLAKTITTISINDNEKFIKIYNVPEEKLVLNSVGYKEHINKYVIDKKKARKELKIDEDKFIVGFHGSILGESYYHKANEEAVNIIIYKIAPELEKEDILFLIAGRNPHRKNKKNVKFLGFVEDLRIFLYALDIAIIPIMRGSGIRTKIIDYISANIPIISTNKGAEGSFIENGVHGYIIRDSVKDLTKRILDMKNNLSSIENFKKNLKILLKEKYSWNNILANVAEVFKNIIIKNSKRI